MTAKLNETRLENTALIRTGHDSVEISWNFKGNPGQVAVFAGDSPGCIDRRHPAAVAQGNSPVRITGLDPDIRHYFELAPDCGSSTIISERRVPLEGSVNFRDLGGYQTVDGRRIKWGQIFRSDNLGRLIDRDVRYLQRMGIRLVCDFRTPAEANKLPDRFPQPSRSRYLHLPIQHGEFDPANSFERIKKGDIDWMTEEFMINGYLKNIDNCGPVWLNFFNNLALGANRPLVFHCTGGKDRAGVCAALILLTLGVSEKTVIEDHGLSNIYIAPVLEKIYAQIRSYGVDPQQVAPYFTASRKAISQAIDHIRNTYGSAAQYLATKAGVEPRILKRLKTDLLE